MTPQYVTNYPNISAVSVKSEELIWQGFVVEFLQWLLVIRDHFLFWSHVLLLLLVLLVCRSFLFLLLLPLNPTAEAYSVYQIICSNLT